MPDRDPATLPKRGAEPPPQFLAHFYCGQTAGCIKMQLGTEVGLSPGDFVSDGDPAPLPKKRAEPPIFGPRLLWPNGWMDENTTLYGSRRRPRPHCVRRGPSSPAKGHCSPPLFGLCLLWPRSPISATAELVFSLFSNGRPSQQLLSSCFPPVNLNFDPCPSPSNVT